MVKAVFKILWVSVALWLAYSLLYYLMIPDVKVLKKCMKTSMFSVDVCPGTKNYATLSSIAKYMQQAVIASEDARFYVHEGFDIEAIKDSIHTNLENKTYARGGSTITQQLAKNAFLSGKKSLSRKLIEAKLTYNLEKNFSKSEILEKYLNMVEFGKDIYGVVAAAKFYFNKLPANLTLPESAFLAMLLPNPEKYSVSFRQKKLSIFARSQMKRILRNMDLAGFISTAKRLDTEALLGYFPWRGQDFPPVPPPILPDEPLNNEPDDETQEEPADTHLF